MDAFTGEIRAFGFGYNPAGWAPCDGRTMSIQQFPALYSILATRFGGDGKTTFKLPNLCGLAPIHFGTLAGSSTTLPFAQTSGTSSETLSLAQIPAHTHTAQGLGAIPTGVTPTDKPTAATLISTPRYQSTGYDGWATSSPSTTLHPNTLSASGANASHSNVSPCLTMNFCICLDNIYPVKS